MVRAGDGGLAPLTTMVAGLAVSRAVKLVTGIATSLKWPNDVLIGEAKLAGILCEAHAGDHVIVGIGINLGTPAGGWPAGPMGQPAALIEHLERPGEQLRRRLLGEVLSQLKTLLNSDVPGDVLAAWSELDALSGREVVCSMGTAGTACGINPDGSLRVETPDGLVSVRAGSVRLREAAESPKPELGG